MKASTVAVGSCMVLFCAGSARAQMISFGPPQQMDHPPPAVFESTPRAAVSGTGYVVAWQGTAPMAARVSASGEIVDQTPITIDPGTNSVNDIRVSSNGCAVLVTWFGLGLLDPNGSDQLIGAQLLSSSLQLVGSRILQDPRSPAAAVPSSAFDGTKFIAVSTTSPTQFITSHPGIFDFGVDLSGNRVTGVLGVLQTILPNFNPEVACAATRCLVAYHQNSGSLGVPSPPDPKISVLFTGEPSAGPFPAGFDLTSTADGPEGLVRIASDGNGWLLVWVGSSTNVIHAARVDSTGHVLDAPPLSIATNLILTTLSATFDGQLYLVLWSDTAGHMALARVTPAGDVLDPGGVDGPPGTDPTAAGHLLTYVAPGDGATRVFIRTISDSDGGAGGAGGMDCPTDVRDGGAGGRIDAGAGGAGGMDGGVDAGAGGMDGGVDAGAGGGGGAGGRIDAGSGGAGGGAGSVDAGAGGAAGSIDAATEAPATMADGAPATDAGPPPGHSNGCSCVYADPNGGAWSTTPLWLLAAGYAAARRRRRAPPR